MWRWHATTSLVARSHGPQEYVVGAQAYAGSAGQHRGRPVQPAAPERSKVSQGALQGGLPTPCKATLQGGLPAPTATPTSAPTPAPSSAPYDHHSLSPTTSACASHHHHQLPTTTTSGGDPQLSTTTTACTTYDHHHLSPTTSVPPAPHVISVYWDLSQDYEAAIPAACGDSLSLTWDHWHGLTEITAGMRASQV